MRSIELLSARVNPVENSMISCTLAAQNFINYPAVCFLLWEIRINNTVQCTPHWLYFNNAYYHPHKTPYLLTFFQHYGKSPPNYEVIKILKHPINKILRDWVLILTDLSADNEKIIFFCHI